MESFLIASAIGVLVLLVVHMTDFAFESRERLMNDWYDPRPGGVVATAELPKPKAPGIQYDRAA